MQVFAWAAFLLAVGFVLYALIGYPLLLWILARYRSKPVQKQFRPTRVSVILPVHNGEKWLREKLASILALDYPRDDMEVLVISDGSEDATDQIAREFASDGVELVRVPKGGKAEALNAGLTRARGDILFFTDVRQRLAADCLKNLVACFADASVGGACGELIIVDGETQEEASVGLYWKVEKWIRRQLSARGTLLVVTGCLYAIRRRLAQPVPPGSLGDDIFMPQAVLRQGYRVVFEESAKAYDFPTTHHVEFRRKIRTLAALYQYIARRGLGPHWFHFVSYKVTRVLMPYALIVIALSSFFLPSPIAQIAITLQALFYALAALDGILPDTFLLKRISSPARTFCMLMAASLWAVRVFFVPAAELWKTTQIQAPKPRPDA